ncbi:glycoside hydrolase family 32 protein [Arcticibacter tournemirensis]|uniref:beta-fructofuranosidase n=1 Tax=Arcticibacter tournemirensis TaxID=699437 RepID=A0A4Q0MB85_9SPHI|nr:glycoside hydrolase family 32 protein [Arcticibacter tournemirensis]RXF70560.1 glycoside hydrolase family 32 protein [Arcticibacter tournemirensis]
MHRYKHLGKTILSLISFISLSVFAKAQSTWHFEDESLQAETKKPGTVELHITSNRNRPQLVNGFKGKGLRTDGYSTWLSGKIRNGRLRSLQAEFALETYPTDTAGFFALGNGQDWVSACVDRFGQPMLAVRKDGRISYYGSNTTIGKFKWTNIGLSLASGKAELLLNGETIVAVDIATNRVDAGTDSILIGRDWREKSVGILPVTAINGIIDELVASPENLNKTEIAKLNDRREHQQAILAIPEERFKNDFTRPRYHLLPAANWTNETHALIFYKGKYNVFNQKNGANLFLGQINWGHFSSPDLIQWTEHKPVLTPQPGYDQNGIWSGCIISDNTGHPVIFYSAGGDKGMNISAAYPDDDSLNGWHKYSGNPVIKGNPEQFSRKDFHDPIVWKHEDTWYMGVGFGLEENGIQKGTILLYKSTDLKNWTYLHPLFTGDPERDDSGVFWEMPLFWKMGNKYILLVNKVPERRKPAVAMYWTGDFTGEKFVPDDPAPKRLEVINRLLSPSVAIDAMGNTTAIAIIPDETSAQETFSRGWTHLYSIPRVWTLDNGKIKQSPHPALSKLRSSVTEFPQTTIDTISTLLLSKDNHQVEISVDITPGDAKQFGVLLGKDAKGNEVSKIYFDIDKRLLVVDQMKSSLRKYVPLQVRTGPYSVTPGQKINLHLFIDGSVIEGFINNKDAFTTRIFPLNSESTRVEMFSAGGSVQLSEARVWKLKSSNNQTAF